MAENIDVVYLFVVSDGDTWQIKPVPGWCELVTNSGRLSNKIVQEAVKSQLLSQNEAKEYVMYVKAPSNFTLAQLGVQENDAIIFAPSTPGSLGTAGGLGERPAKRK